MNYKALGVYKTEISYPINSLILVIIYMCYIKSPSISEFETTLSRLWVKRNRTYDCWIVPREEEKQSSEMRREEIQWCSPVLDPRQHDGKRFKNPRNGLEGNKYVYGRSEGAVLKEK